MNKTFNVDNVSINTHSSIKITGSKIIYFDPFEISSPSHDADIIFITHKHFDHLDPASILNIAKDNTIYVIPKSIKDDFFAAINVSDDWCEMLAPYDEVSLDGIDVKAWPSYNINKPNHLKEYEWLGYEVRMDGTTYYVAGDTDVNDDIKEVTCDVALIPIGGTYTMDLEEAASFALEISPNVVIPTHYGTIVGKNSFGKKFKKIIEKSTDSIQVILKL